MAICIAWFPEVVYHILLTFVTDVVRRWSSGLVVCDNASQHRVIFWPIRLIEVFPFPSASIEPAIGSFVIFLTNSHLTSLIASIVIWSVLLNELELPSSLIFDVWTMVAFNNRKWFTISTSISSHSRRLFWLLRWTVFLWRMTVDMMMSRLFQLFLHNWGLDLSENLRGEV